MPVPPPFRQQVAHCRTVDGIRIAHAASGHGPVLVKAANGLSHLEFDAASLVWGHAIAELSSDHTLVRHDRRGCGRSDWDVPPVRFSDWVADLEAVVEARALDRFALLGLSDGAAVALAYAARHPARVIRLVLHGAWVRPGVRRAASRPPGGGHDDLREVATSTVQAARMARVEDGVSLEDRLSLVRCPVLLLHATGDPEVPWAEAEWLAERLHDVRLVGLDSAQHLPSGAEAAWARWLHEVRAFLPPEPEPGSPLAALTPREREVVDLLAQGHGNAVIADTLALGMKTVRNHVSNVYRKLRTGNRARTSALARDAGFGVTFRR